MDREGLFAVYMDFFASVNMYATDLGVFPEKSSRQTKKKLQFSNTFCKDHIQKLIVRACIRAEFKTAAFILLIHDCCKLYPVIGKGILPIKSNGHLSGRNKNKLLQSNEKVNKLAKPETIEYFL